MRFTIPTIAAISLATSALAAGINTTQEFYLRTELKTNETDKCAYNNLYIESYHTGAGLSDAVLTANESYAIKGFANVTNITNPSGGVYSYQEFDLGSEFPYGFSVSIPTTYNAWVPVEINAGNGYAGYFFNASGLQGGLATEFGGWLVCDWSHGVPQLFQRLSYESPSAYPAPSSCADVWLKPVYI